MSRLADSFHVRKFEMYHPLSVIKTCISNIKFIVYQLSFHRMKSIDFVYFAFVHHEIANECIFNMDGSDLMGRTIKVSLAQQNQLSKLSSQSAKGQAIWSSDEWFQQHVVGNDEDAKQKLNDAQEDKQTLKD